jgi:uncharacterized repeat protein (TIGR02543 family)
MKHRFLKQLIVASVVTSTMITLSPVGVSAAWVKSSDGNWSYTEGNRYSTGWKQIGLKWYLFDDAGLMRTGWIYYNENWYYMGLDGGMQTGVVQIEGKIYVFAENGGMQKGSCAINGKIYYFDDNGACAGTDFPMPISAFDYYGNSTVPYIPSQILSTGTGNMSSEIPPDGKVHAKQYKVTFKDPYVETDEEQVIKTRTIDENTKMLLYKPLKSGYTFVEWNTKSDGDGTGYEYDGNIIIKADITLYAQWKTEEVAVDTTTIKVTGIKISGSNNISEITTKDGSLQMTKSVTPGDASDQKVKWSVSNQDGIATIDTTGKLKAVSDGKVIVKATADDGSGITSNEFEVTISGQ